MKASDWLIGLGTAFIALPTISALAILSYLEYEHLTKLVIGVVVVYILALVCFAYAVGHKIEEARREGKGGEV
jgi:mannitol-specific phosphotransferase system IIBC component